MPPFQPGAELYSQGFGTVAENVEVPTIQTRAPTSSDYKYPVGKRWLDTVAGSEYTLMNISQSSGIVTANWGFLGSSSGDLNSLTTDDATIVLPSSSTILVHGTTNQTVSTGANSPGAITIALSPTLVAPGSITATTSITSTTSITAGVGLTVTTGNLTVSAGTAVLGPTNIVGSANINISGAATTTIGTGGTGIVAIGNATGNTAVTGSLTASTTLTATSGAITATSGSFTAVAAGTGLVLPVSTGSGSSGGAVTCTGRAGSVTFTGVSVAGNADITLTMTNTSVAGSSTRLVYAMAGCTTGASLSVKSVTSSANTVAWVVTNGTGLTTSTANIVFDFIVLN